MNPTERPRPVDQVIDCDCGFTVRAATDDQLVELATSHANDVHGVDIRPDQVLALARPVG